VGVLLLIVISKLNSHPEPVDFREMVEEVDEIGGVALYPFLGCAVKRLGDAQNCLYFY
jgi:hypothetical protein